MLEHNDAGFRKVPGTGLRNTSTGELVYEPPQSLAEIQDLMTNLEKFINDDKFLDTDPLIKMALLHYQFESIHPFYDGNGRTGRILCVLYLVLKDLLDIPVLYLSRHIIRTKEEYYRLLQKVHTDGAWEEWILYMLTAIEKTSIATISLVEGIKSLMMDYKHKIRKTYPFYSQDLINNLFFHPYTKIDFLKRDLKVSRHTATKYLDVLAEDGFLEKRKLGRTNYYINRPLFELFIAVSENE
jgi:Fic family protein